MMNDGRYVFDIYHSYVTITMVIIGVVVPFLFYIFNIVLLRRRSMADAHTGDELKKMVREMQAKYARETIERHDRSRGKF